VYPSGSTIKPFVATSALEAGIVNEDTAFETPPFIEIGQWKFPDWKDHGLTDIKTAIAQSNNIFFYALGGGYAQSPIKKGLGPDGMKKGLEKFGFGKPTGIDLTSEEEGFLPTPEWKKRTTGESWYIGNTYNMAIGQGDLLATPLQIATATSAIANGGRLYRPFVVSEITDSDGNKIDNPLSGEKLVSEGIFSANSLRIVKEGMRKTTQLGGSAFGVFGTDFPLEVAAKTGTAQFGNEEKTHAWFTSFAPYNDPQIAVTVIVEGAGEGYEAAAPVAKDVLKWWSENK
jgi:penicillin-binding protein 2